MNLNEIKSIKREASNLLRSNQIIRKIFPNEILAEGDEPSYYEELIFKQIWRQAGYMFTEGNGIPQDERDEAIKKYQNIYKALVDNEPKLEIFRRKENDPYVLIEPLNHQLINAKNSFSCIRSIEFSRKGNFTCPVETFLVFISDNFIDIEAEELSLYDNLFSINDVHNLQENDSKIPKDYSLIESEGCLSIVFK